jgi:hypothetical protein
MVTYISMTDLSLITHRVRIDDDLLCIGTKDECEDRAAALERRGWFEPESIKVEEIE